MPDPCEYFRPVALDGHPAPAAVSALPAPELLVECVDVELKPRGHAVQRDDERLAVRFASGKESQHEAFILLSMPYGPGVPERSRVKRRARRCLR